ncbi:RNA polymerase subunit sigma-70 [Leptobacterium flavescens]|uniref:RNA polymerase subunit sigma-70 n=1 Tax=Leptobacterium flavescens TaxID=472055 RepID=A0A6P0UIL3_9FLAO|nr:anti-sigma factor [Leptobacterium flavescens]NER12372.1 RNA polymerase subunit sigma-70 [Leptobacterium flavescens]
MKDNVKIFLESDLLEKYLIGSTTEEESIQVEHYISKYPDVSRQYEELQDNLENYARSFSVSAPQEVKEQVLQAINKKATSHRIHWFSVAASVAAIVFCTTTIMLWLQNNLLLEENSMVSTEIRNLKEDVLSTNTKLEDIKDQFVVLNNPETRKYVLRGNQRAKNLRTVAYINPVERLSMIDVVSLPELPEEQVYQMWAEVDGVMINLGVLKKRNEEKLISIPFKENASGYNITIEPKGGNEQATAENVVANISFEQQ